MRTSRFSPLRNRATQRHILNATKGQKDVAEELHEKADAADAAKAKEIAELSPITRTSHWTWAARVYRIEIHDGERKHVLIAERTTESSAIATAISQDHLCIVEKWNGRTTVRIWTGYKPPKVVTERCEGCHRVVDPSSLADVDVLVAKQTYSSPAEYERRRACDICRSGDERDDDYERANQRFKEETGSEL